MAEAYPGLLPAVEDMAVEVMTARGAIQVRAVNAEGGELAEGPNQTRPAAPVATSDADPAEG